MTRTPAAAIALLRRLADRLEREAAVSTDLLEVADKTALASALRRYEAEAPHGLALDQALGVRPSRGGETWWRAEARQRRDALVRQFASLACEGFTAAAAARAITDASRRLARTRRPKGAEAILAEAMAQACELPNTPKQIATILMEMKPPLLTSTPDDQPASKLRIEHAANADFPDTGSAPAHRQ